MNWKAFILAGCVALAAGIFWASPSHANGLAPLEIDGATTVDADGFIELFQSESDLVVVDSRKPGDFAAERLQTAVNLTDTDTDANSLAEVVPTKSTPVIFYCNGRSCGRAANAVEIALAEGYERVYYYAAGLEEWTGRGLPTVSD
jgi:rhodanese-related sulfurtransferase